MLFSDKYQLRANITNLMPDVVYSFYKSIKCRQKVISWHGTHLQSRLHDSPQVALEQKMSARYRLLPNLAFTIQNL